MPPSFRQALRLTTTGPRPSSFSIWPHPTSPSGERLFVRERGPLATQELKWQRDWRGVAWHADGEAATGVGWGGWESGGEASEEDEQEAGRRRAEGRRAPRGPAGCTWPRRAQRERPAQARSLRPGAQEAVRSPGCGARAGSIVVLPSPSRALPQHHSQDNSTTRRCPRTSPAWAGGAREKGADQAPQPNLGCSRAAWRLWDPDGGRGVSVRLRIDPSWHQGRCRGRRDAAGAEGGTAAGAAELPAGELVTRGGRRPREQREGGLENVKKAADCAGWTQGDGRGGVWAEINHERLEPPQTVAGESGALRCPGTER